MNLVFILVLAEICQELLLRDSSKLSSDRFICIRPQSMGEHGFAMLSCMLCLTHPSDGPQPSDTSNILFISHPITIKLDIHYLVLYLSIIQVFFE